MKSAEPVGLAIALFGVPGFVKANGQMLREINSRDVRVLVVWEPVLATDFTAPSTAALARIADVRAVQYWDRKRDLSHLLGEHGRSTVVWDYIAVYAPGSLWQDAPPKPVYSDHPVRDVIGGARDAIQHLPDKRYERNRKE